LNQLNSGLGARPMAAFHFDNLVHNINKNALGRNTSDVEHLW